MYHDDVFGRLAILADDLAMADPNTVQPALERRLTPMVRLALRKGIGAPALVSWVLDARRRLPAAPAANDVDHCANTITRWLSGELLCRRNDMTLAPAGGQTRLHV